MQVDLEGFARRITSRDLAPSIPLYILGTSQGLPPELSDYPAIGLFSSWLDATAREWLEAAGRWRGRGPAIFLNDVLIRGMSIRDAGGDHELAEELYRDRLTAVFCHELSHALGRPLDLDDDYPRSAVVTLMEAALTAPRPERKAADTPQPEPWEGHRADFIRVLCHVVYRAERLLGERLPGEWLFAQTYGLAPLFIYRDVLADEVEAMAGDSFETIRNTPLPGPLLHLWRRDLVQYYRHQTVSGRNQR